MSKIVERTLDFFELFATQGKPLGLSEIARLLDIPVSSCRDVLQTLVARGYLTEVAPRGCYYPTMRWQAVSRDIAWHDPIALRAERLLTSLRDQLDETVILGKILGSTQGVYLLVLESTHPLRFHNFPGQAIVNLHATSAGKVILGRLAPKAFEQWLETADLTPVTPATITQKDRLRANIAAGTARGWQRNDEESTLGATTVGTAFTWLNLPYFILIAGPTPRVAPDLDRIVGLLMATARSLENAQFEVEG